MESEFVSVLREKFHSYPGDQASVLQLLSWHPNPAAITDSEGRSLLVLACKKEWGDVAKMLLEMVPSNSALDTTTVYLQFKYPSITGTDQARALELLSQLPNPAAVRNKESRTLLHWACLNKWKDVASALVEEHVQCQSLKPVVILGFQYPSITGIDQARALELLSQLTNPAAIRDEEGRTLLHWACRNQWGDVVKSLIEIYDMESE